MNRVAKISALFRYPVKSMAGESLQQIELGWHGVEGDRRYAFLRRGVGAGYPWLTASKLASLVAYAPLRSETDTSNPSLVRTPSGETHQLSGEELRAEVSRAFGGEVDLVHISNGIFDDGLVSIIDQRTVDRVCDEGGVPSDVRRFRPNILVEAEGREPFGEDEWVGKTMRLGEEDDAPRVVISDRDVRCVMINLDPASGRADANVLKAAVRLNENRAGVYAAVVRPGTLRVGAAIFVE
jgi:uncharacterized protein YcbX